MNKDSLRQIVNIVVLVVTLIANGMATTGQLGGRPTAEVANSLPILFVPANYVFSIWGLIYTLLIAFVVYQALPSQRTNPALRKIGWWFAVSCVANFTWLILFQYNLFPLSMVAMIVLLVSLIVMYTRLGIGQVAVSTRERWLVHLPFSVYLGWITVATVANAAYVLYDAGWDGFGISGAVWATIMLVVAGGISLAMIYQRRDVAYTAVLLWALVGIVNKQAETPLVAGTAVAVAVVLVVALAARWFTTRGSEGWQLAQA
ncbi:MAG: tryptophan-rich sensory protein [Anaerolineae bacterium]|nr:tryptophan-rich sensory protein [Anaerolineae bacterium]